MLTINKLRVNQTIDFAAEELKKYLRMMMPAAGEIKIPFHPDVTDGFCLGFLGDFGLSFEGKDAKFDDIVHIENLEAYFLPSIAF